MFQQKGKSYIETNWKKINRHQTKIKKINSTTTRITAGTGTKTPATVEPYRIPSSPGIIHTSNSSIVDLYKFRLKMANTLSVMANVLRNVVSKKRIRYKEGGFNLDLCYICDNVIAMGYPADNLESFYRNRIEDVYKFLENNHKDRYKIYNLCLERSYDINRFHGRVSVYPFEDHNPPTIELIQKFCEDINSWLKANKLNVAAVHCKAGKGRTGTMICCYLLYSGQQNSPAEALACYDEKRTKDRKGVTIPSQRRYVQYFSKLVRSGLPYETRTLQLCGIRFSEANYLHGQGVVQCSIYVLRDAVNAVRVQPLHHSCIDFRKSYTLDIKSPSLAVAGDIKVELRHNSSRKKLFHFWVNTFFVCDDSVLEEEQGTDEESKLVYTLHKSEIDDVHKDKEHKCYAEDFKVQLLFYCGPIIAMNDGRTAIGQLEANRISNQHGKMTEAASADAQQKQQRLLQQNNCAMLPQNSSSSGSDLNYMCDQKSSSSAASASANSLLTTAAVGGGGGGLPAAAAIANHQQQQHQNQSQFQHNNHEQQQKHPQFAAQAYATASSSQQQRQLQYQPAASFHANTTASGSSRPQLNNNSSSNHNNTSRSSSRSNNSSISSHSSAADTQGGGISSAGGCSAAAVEYEDASEDWESAAHTTNGSYGSSNHAHYATAAPSTTTMSLVCTDSDNYVLLSSSGAAAVATSSAKEVHLHPYNGKMLHAKNKNKKCAHGHAHATYKHHHHSHNNNNSSRPLQEETAAAVVEKHVLHSSSAAALLLRQQSNLLPLVGSAGACAAGIQQCVAPTPPPTSKALNVISKNLKPRPRRETT